MRQIPDKKYSPNTPKYSNMTIYEMAYSMDDSNTPSAQTGFPALIEWLFDDIYDYFNYTLINNNTITLNDILKYKNVVAFFMYNFLNREICSKDPLVFRSKMNRELINMFLDFDLYNKLKEVADATTELNYRLDLTEGLDLTGSMLRTDNLTEVTERDVQNDFTNIRDITHSGTNTRTDNLTETTERDAENSSTYSEDSTIGATTSSSGTDTKTLNTLKTIAGTDTTDRNLDVDSTERQLIIDYPQSTADHSQIGEWDYASGANDNIGHRDEEEDTIVTTDKTEADTGTITDQKVSTGSESKTGDIDSTKSEIIDDNISRINTGTQSHSDSYTDNLDDTASNTIDENVSKRNTGTRENAETAEYDRTREETRNYNKLSDVESLEIKLQLLNKFKSIYSKLQIRLENCFISIYVDEDRDGWIDPSVIWEV